MVSKTYFSLDRAVNLLHPAPQHYALAYDLVTLKRQTPRSPKPTKPKNTVIQIQTGFQIPTGGVLYR